MPAPPPSNRDASQPPLLVSARGALTEDQRQAALQRVRDATKRREADQRRLREVARRVGVRVSASPWSEDPPAEAGRAERAADAEAAEARLETDVAKSLHSYDQWLGGVDERFTRAIRALEQRVAALEAAASADRERLEAAVRRAEALLDSARSIVERQRGGGSHDL